MDVVNTNSLALAYIGDAVYEVYVRKHLLEKGITKGDELQRHAIEYVSASGQAKALTKIEDKLTAAEKETVRRARNHKTGPRQRHLDMKEYRLATGLEALIGSAYLAGETDRLEELMAEMIAALEEED